MLSSLANVILFVALVTTSAIVAVMYRKLRKLDTYHAEYKKVFNETGAALVSAQDAVSRFGAESRDTLAALGTRMEEANALIARLEDLTNHAGAQLQIPTNGTNT